jgi:hypothetical protein
MSNQNKCIFEEPNGRVHVHILSIKDKPIPLVPKGPATSHENFLETGNIVPSLAINQKLHNTEFSIPFKVQVPPESLTEVTCKE